MSYTKQNFESGAILYARQLNAMDDKIAEMDSAIDDLNYVEIAVKTFSANPSSAERGSAVSSVVLSYTLNTAPTTLSIDGTAVQSLTASGSVTKTGSFTATANDNWVKSWTITAKDARNATATKTATLKFLNRIYYGVASVPAQINDAFLVGFSDKPLSDSRAKSFSVNAISGTYIWYALPNRLGQCSFSVNGFDGGFSKVSTFSHTNASGYSENYDVWRSDNPSLGSTNVVVS